MAPSSRTTAAGKSSSTRGTSVRFSVMDRVLNKTTARDTGRAAQRARCYHPRMSIDKKLLEILCCPVTKVPVKLLPKPKLGALNERVAAGEVKRATGDTVSEPLDEALITENGTTIYRIDSGIPVMLEDEAIPTAQLGEF